jgi:hypothetical protein
MMGKSRRVVGMAVTLDAGSSFARFRVLSTMNSVHDPQVFPTNLIPACRSSMKAQGQPLQELPATGGATKM